MKRERMLETTFCGITCENPFLLSSSCIAGNEEMVDRALAMGWGGAVFKTIGFYHPEEVSPRFDAIDKEGASFVGFRNLEQISDHPLEENLEALYQLKKKFPEKLIVSSIMGQTEEEWTRLAEMSTQAGVDMIECNFSCPQMAKEKMGSDVGVDAELVNRYCQAVRKGTDLPVLAKMTPNLADMTVPAKAAIAGGADGLAAINTVKCITTVDLQHHVLPDIGGYSSVSGYSGKAVKPIALRFIRDMAACKELQGTPISGMGGIENWHDAMEFFSLGAGTVQVTTSVMQYGYRIIDDLIDGLCFYMQEKKVQSVHELVGSALPNVVESDVLDRHSMVYPVWNYDTCIGCGRCYISCQDGGHQAIYWNRELRKPQLLGKQCVGCHLCKLVCPVQAIHSSKRVAKRMPA
ncbi:NAD-dependent dihydropyrimidine dehydrogenase subunit PreA [uncultured Megasphaera sp.]|uniref:NAD-dependent dihydropyrimidine dehydrogenase subunit PreA n=1 Tax=uncultured Megasphaera sp. TaxID=165188 RepID=UPI002659FA69|nr:NAD-dependent dihydropyrimidine dehydrogenase subunit PreA [uncultured Megasphaera sp.]